MTSEETMCPVCREEYDQTAKIKRSPSELKHSEIKCQHCLCLECWIALRDRDDHHCPICKAVLCIWIHSLEDYVNENEKNVIEFICTSFIFIDGKYHKRKGWTECEKVYSLYKAECDERIEAVQPEIFYVYVKRNFPVLEKRVGDFTFFSIKPI